METHVETAGSALRDRTQVARVKMLGPLAISCGGTPLELPASRKVRALFAYLALSRRPVGRSRLCELLWDVPNDPRGELRWCLSKLRGLLNRGGRQRVVASDDAVALDLGDFFVDAVEIAAAAGNGIEALGPESLRWLASHFEGDFLEGLEIDRSPLFQSWLTAQRRRFSGIRATLAEHLVGSLPPDGEEAIADAESWVELAPFDARAQRALLTALAVRSRIGDCEDHLAAAAKLFAAEDLDFGPVRDAWKEVRDGKPDPSLPIRSNFTTPASLPAAITPSGAGDFAPRRASLAVMPFADTAGSAGGQGGAAAGLTHDIITRLAKLRSLFVIARGSVFALAERNIGPEDAGRRLNVDYVASGSVRGMAGRTVVEVELVETRTARIVWAETYDHRPDDAFLVLDEIGNRIVSSIASEIEVMERNRAILKPPNSLDAWEAYHRGLWHMYRFTRTDNDQARHFFETAVGLDPTFSRPHAGLSFTYWQSAFQHWGNREQDTAQAFETAGRSLIVDDQDPAAHWAMGRALWLRGSHDASLGELEQAVDLSPNFALGHYSLSFIQSQSGDPQAAIRSANHSRQLSPFDPLLFGMLGARALAHVRLGQFEEAAEWSLKAAARPNAHIIILAIAAHCLALAGRIEEGQVMAANIRRTIPRYSIDDFLGAFRFTPDAEALFRGGAKRIWLD